MSVRITGGQWRSRQVKVHTRVRPTPDRVRETLFNWLGHDLTGWHCLDAFAGSGLLGLEAASRGAQITWVEQQPGVYAQLRKNIQTLDPQIREFRINKKGLSTSVIVHSDILRYIAHCTRQHPPPLYDLIMLDPPFRACWLEKVLPLLPALSTPDTLLYVESEQRRESLPGWKTIKHGQTRQVCYQLMDRHAI